MWLGQNSTSTYEQHFFKLDRRSETFAIEHREIEEIPAKMKCLDEACMNAVDEYRRNVQDAKIAPRDKMNRLTVTLSDDRKRVSIRDNGRGIPMENAEGVFLHLMYGENFDDKAREEHVAGQNGVGISLVRIVSQYFRVYTACAGKSYSKLFTVNDTFLDALKAMKLSAESIDLVVKHFDEHSTLKGCEAVNEKQVKKLEPLMKKLNLISLMKNAAKSDHGTLVEFELDKRYFNNLDVRFDAELVSQYLLDIALTNPGLEVIFSHKKKDTVYKFKKGMDELFANTTQCYYKLAHTDPASPSRIDLAAYVIMGEGKHLTWVNSNFASLGGSAIEYIENRICDEVRKKNAITALEKRLKTQSTRNDVRSCFHMLINLKILNPRFKSQDKSYLINDLNAEIRDAIDKNLDKMLRKTTLVDDIKALMERRTHLKALEDAEKGLRRASRILIPKLIAPTGTTDDKGRVLLIGEGDSAIAGLRPVRNPRLHGLFPLRGKPLNVQGMSLAKALSNEEMKNIVAIIGLPLEGKVKRIADLNYDKVSIVTDADFDGYAIRSLMLSFFYEYWPELYDLGFVHITNAPLYEVEIEENGKKSIEFCIDDADYDAVMKRLKKTGGTMIRKKRNKGLGETGKEAMSFAIENCMTKISVKQTTTANKIQRLWFHRDYAEDRRRVISAYSMTFYEE
ncbi:MAG: ATP-binding protein [Spirochaetes bacterium]|nr:ATP-binding protein [Spirochaetota bacterium]